jgi:hypothetical protein
MVVNNCARIARKDCRSRFDRSCGNASEPLGADHVLEGRTMTLEFSKKPWIPTTQFKAAASRK